MKKILATALIFTFSLTGHTSMLKIIVFCFIILPLPSLVIAQSSNDKTKISRRGFFGLVGGAASLAAMPTASLATTTSSITPAINVGYFETLREMLYRTNQLGDMVGPRPHLSQMHSALTRYYRGVKNALQQNGLSAKDLSRLETLQDEVRTFYPSADEQLRHIDQEMGGSEKVELLTEILEFRSLLGQSLLTRVAWQLSYPKENIIPRNSSPSELRALLAYQNHLVAYAEVLAEHSISMPETTERIFRMWVNEANSLLELEVMRTWQSQVLKSTAPMCRTIFK